MNMGISWRIARRWTIPILRERIRKINGKKFLEILVLMDLKICVLCWSFERPHFQNPTFVGPSNGTKNLPSGGPVIEGLKLTKISPGNSRKARLNGGLPTKNSFEVLSQEADQIGDNLVSGHSWWKFVEFRASFSPTDRWIPFVECRPSQVVRREVGAFWSFGGS